MEVADLVICLQVVGSLMIQTSFCEVLYIVNCRTVNNIVQIRLEDFGIFGELYFKRDLRPVCTK